MASFTSFIDSTNRWNLDTLKNFGQITPIVQNHLKKVFITFCFAVAVAAVGAYLNLVGIVWLLSPVACAASCVWLLSTPPFEERKRLTLLLAAALFQGVFLGPFIYGVIQIETSVIFRLSVATVLAIGCFSGAYLAAKRKEYLYLGGLVSSGLFILMWFNFTTLIYGDSTAIVKFVVNNCRFYLGHLLFVGLFVMDTQEIVEKAHFGDLDYVKHALILFADLFAIFVRVLDDIIFQIMSYKSSRGLAGSQLENIGSTLDKTALKNIEVDTSYGSQTEKVLNNFLQNPLMKGDVGGSSEAV